MWSAWTLSVTYHINPVSNRFFSISEQGAIVILHVVALLKGVKGHGRLKEITVGSCIKAPEFRMQTES